MDGPDSISKTIPVPYIYGTSVIGSVILINVASVHLLDIMVILVKSIVCVRVRVRVCVCGVAIV